MIEILKKCASKITSSSTKERHRICRELVSCINRDGKFTNMATQHVLIFLFSKPYKALADIEVNFGPFHT